MPTQSSRLLHTQLRMSLLDSSVQRVVLLSHNSGSVTASQVIAQLCADLPDTKLGKLEVYTFGAASAEFVAPLGEMAEPRQTSGDEQQDRPSRPAARTVPHFEHFAFEDDVFAQIGILGSLREDLDGRFCGGVFVIDGQGLRRAQSRTPPSLSASGGRPLRADTRLSGLSMDDYMAALFPTAQAAGGAAVVSALDSIMGIDRDLAEKRELAAIANYQALLPPSSAASPPTAKVPSRRSWTYLGATAGAAVHGVGHGGYHGLKGLEMVRQGCRGCNGHRGAEVSWLVRYVAVGDELDPREGSEGTATPIRTA